MRILVVHDRYDDSLPSGENAIVDWEVSALQAHGVAVRMMQTSRPDLVMPDWKKAIQHLGGAYSATSRRRLRREIETFSPDIVHVHNIWPHMTPSVYMECRTAGVPVVQTLHNYRIMCISDFLCRNGKPCELCLGKNFAWQGVRHRCLGGGFTRSLAKAAAVGIHNSLDTWNRLVDTFIAPTDYMRDKFVRAGLQAAKLRIKTPCSPDLGFSQRKREYFCFAGRLSHEKGVHVLLKLWENLPGPELRIAGTGPFEEQVRRAAEQNPAIRFLGMLPKHEVAELMGGAIATLVPSTWDEPCPIVLVQSFSVGTPVIASDLGPRAAIVEHNVRGLIFPDGDVEALGRMVRWASGHEAECRAMGVAARRRYEERYSIERSHEQLMDIYSQTLSATQRR